MTADAELKPKSPAELVTELIPLVRRIEPSAEIDFSWSQDAITICDMRKPAALRYGVLYSRRDLAVGIPDRPGELERRVRAFMAKG